MICTVEVLPVSEQEDMTNLKENGDPCAPGVVNDPLSARYVYFS
jgi:hypothetical protein